eukprot:scaffold1809_cov386-Prasinococcus_capsulatus_cf.AAC.6
MHPLDAVFKVPVAILFTWIPEATDISAFFVQVWIYSYSSLFPVDRAFGIRDRQLDGHIIVTMMLESLS